MSLFQALILGIVQGATEFLPISSSGHLVLVPFMAGWEEPSLSFIIATHLGTLLAVVWVFRKRLIELLRALFGRGSTEDRRLVWLLALASVPAAVIGAVFADQIERSFERPVSVAFLFAATGWILFSAETSLEERKEPPREERDLNKVDAALIGLGQAAAILPSISRSGATIAAGMWRGVSREAAARFSFVLSVPVIFGATLVKLPDMVREGATGSGGAMVIGVVTSAVVGALSIRWLMAFVARHSLRPFGVYCLLAATAGILTALARG